MSTEQQAVDKATVEAPAAYTQKQWGGNYWGARGAILDGLFQFLSLLYSAYGSAPTKKHKLLTLGGVVVTYVVIRAGYLISDMNANQLDILASVSRKLGFRSHAILCWERVNTFLENAPYGTNHTTHMLALVGLMLAYQECHNRKRVLVVSSDLLIQLHLEHFSPPEQEIRILKSLAIFFTREIKQGRDYDCNKKDAEAYATKALTLARKLGAKDQEEKIKKEFPYVQ